MKNARIWVIVASIGLPLVTIAAGGARADATAADAAKQTTAAPTSTATDKTAAVSDSATAATKPGRLRFRSATSSGCTSAKGGVGEADIRRAEQARENNKN